MASLPPILPPDEQLPAYHAVDDRKMAELPPIAMDIDTAGRDRGGSYTPSIHSKEAIEAAEALAGLSEGIRSPGSATTFRGQSEIPSRQPEPLLTLLTSQHPYIASTINNSLSAYTTTKSTFTPFRVGAEFVERTIAQPVANTVGTATRMTGVETGIRWLYTRRDSTTVRTSQLETGSKRRRDSNEMEVSNPAYIDGPPVAHRQRGMSETESLPRYDDDQRSPSYEEYATSHVGSPTSQIPSMSLQQQSWHTRFAIHTSGLGVAMSDESLRSLKYCLSWLRWANGHLHSVLSNLQALLGEWDQSQRPGESGSGRPPRIPALIMQDIQAWKDECVKVLKNALDVVSRYAGGSLPENARWIVKSHLTSLPARFRLAFQSQAIDSDRKSASRDEEAQQQPEAVTGAHRVIVLAREGLDMISQVATVVDGTIISAEDWLEKMGRKKETEPLLEESRDSDISMDDIRSSEQSTGHNAVVEKS